LVFILSNKEFTPTVEDVVNRIKQKRDQRKKRFKEARRVAKAAAMRTGSSAAPAVPAAADLSPSPVVAQLGDEVGVVIGEPEAHEDDEYDVEFDESGGGEELDEHAIQALLDGIYDADASKE
jgi:hypothetical protein